VGTVPETKRYIAHVVFWVGLFLALPLWREFHEPEQPLWNVFLAAFLIALVAGAFFGVRHFQKNGIKVGEARFTAADRDAR
jgi:succinate dehydrogenase/fumarate reductase cytochrome b subunit